MKKILIILLVPLAILLFLPAITQRTYILHLVIMSFVFAVISQNWDLTMGYLGLFNFGHLSFFAIGAYTSGILSINYQVSPWACLFLGGLTAMVTGSVLTLPTIRLGGRVFSLFSFSFQQVLFYLIRSNPMGLTGGSQGLSRIPPLQVFDYQLQGASSIPAYYLALTLFLAITLILYYTVKSPIGMAFTAIRDSENYAISRGIDPFKYRFIAVVLGAFFTGIIGAFYAHFLGVVGPEILGWGNVVLTCCMVEFGGLGTLLGPTAAAFLLTILSNYLSGLEAYRNIIISLIMFFVLIAFPSGLAGIFTPIKTHAPKLTNLFKTRNNESKRGEK